MEMIVHLDEDVFEMVKNGKKNIEVRINDEKRRKLKIGDKLIFLKRPNDDEIIETKVISLDYYDNFEELVKHYDMSDLYLETYSKADFVKELERFYTLDEQKEYGVVAIGFIKE